MWIDRPEHYYQASLERMKQAALTMDVTEVSVDRLVKVWTLLEKDFPPPDRVVLKEEDGIFGYVVSSHFEGKDTLQRVDLIWNILDSNLTNEELRHVFTIVALTPDEELAHTV